MLQLMPRVNKSAIAITAVMLATLSALATLGAWPAVAQGLTPVGWYYDGRDDARDFPTNGFFPGDFAADPASAAIGAAGLFGSTPARAHRSQLIDGTLPDQSYCVRRYRSYDPASATFIGYDGARHRCQ
jgi:hypothetical protein